MNDSQTLVYAQPTGAALSVRHANGTLWLSQAQIGELFGVGQAAISKHIKNIYEVSEVDEHGSYSILEYLDKNVPRKIKLYNLDMILSVGYRVSRVETLLSSSLPVYHVGASMKDAGLKMFAVMRTSFDPSLVLPSQQ